MKAQIRKWTVADGVVLVDQVLSVVFDSIPQARRAIAEMTERDPDCDRENMLSTSARWTQYSIARKS